MRVGLVFSACGTERRYKQRLCLALFVISLCISSASVAEQLQDPMRPPGVSAAGIRNAAGSARNYTLSSTFIARSHKSAIINGRHVQVGDMVGNARIVEILPTEVRLRRGGHTTTLHLLPISVKTPAPTE